MELCHALREFLWGILRRFWLWIPAFVLDPYDIWDRIVKPMLPPEVQFDLPWSPGWAPIVLLALIGWAAFLTYFELRKRMPAQRRPDASVRWLFDYLNNKSVWAIGDSNDDGNLVFRIEAEIRDAAKAGRITVWGRIYPSNHVTTSSTQTDIGKDYWLNAMFDLTTICTGKDKTSKTEGVDKYVSPIFEDLKVNKAECFNEWPKSSWVRLLCDWHNYRMRHVDLRGGDGTR